MVAVGVGVVSGVDVGSASSAGGVVVGVVSGVDVGVLVMIGCVGNASSAGVVVVGVGTFGIKATSFT